MEFCKFDQSKSLKKKEQDAEDKLNPMRDLIAIAGTEVGSQVSATHGVMSIPRRRITYTAPELEDDDMFEEPTSDGDGELDGGGEVEDDSDDNGSDEDDEDDEGFDDYGNMAAADDDFFDDHDVDDSRPNDEPVKTKSGRMIRPPKW